MWLQVTQTALMSRIRLIMLQALSNLIIPDHDAGVFKYPTMDHYDDIPVQLLLGGFPKWDAQYFMHISLFGYTFENTLAFFPLLPMMVRAISTTIYPFIWFMTIEGVTLSVYIIANTVIFVFTAHTLYKLTAFLFNKRFAMKCVQLFSYNPASIFFSAPYTESLFALLTFNTILNCSQINCRRINRFMIKSIIFIALSSCTRSNGLLNIGFLVYSYVHSMLVEITTQNNSFKFIISRVIVLMMAVGVCLIPFCCIQFYFYTQFCSDFDHHLPKFLVDMGIDHGYVLPGTHSVHNQTWCDYKILPLSYSYVQAIYWDVGFFKYYTLNNIPNFMLAAPIIYIVATETYKFICKHKSHLFHLGLLRVVFGEKRKIDFRTDALFACVVHAGILMLFCLVFVHVQVTTRMLCSATPVVYWFAAGIKRRWIQYYFIGYYVIGTVMFVNFLPWT